MSALEARIQTVLGFCCSVSSRPCWKFSLRSPAGPGPELPNTTITALPGDTEKRPVQWARKDEFCNNQVAGGMRRRQRTSAVGPAPLHERAVCWDFDVYRLSHDMTGVVDLGRSGTKGSIAGYAVLKLPLCSSQPVGAASWLQELAHEDDTAKVLGPFTMKSCTAWVPFSSHWPCGVRTGSVELRPKVERGLAEPPGQV